MRKIRLIFIAWAFVFALSTVVGCNVLPDAEHDTNEFSVETSTSVLGSGTDYVNDNRPSQETAIDFICYQNDWLWFCYKTVADSPTAYYLIDRIATLTETGEISPKMSDKEFDDSHYDYDDPYIPSGTMWLKIGNDIYRVDMYGTPRVCRVESHYGEGKVLNADEELVKAIINAYRYYPNNYYVGSFSRSDNVLRLQHVYAAESDVSVSIRSIKLPKAEGEQSVIGIELMSDIDKKVNLSCSTYQGDDIMGDEKSMTVELHGGVKKALEISIYAWPCSMYSMCISADNTVIEVTVDSRYAGIEAFDLADMERLSDYLDSEGFVNGMRPKDLRNLVNSFSYNGVKIPELIYEVESDGDRFAATDAEGEHFGYGIQTSYDRFHTQCYTTCYFNTRTELEGFELPCGIEYGDALKQVIDKLSGTDTFKKYISDEGETGMTLFVSDDMMLVLSKESLGENSYTLEYRHYQTYENSNGETVRAARFLTFSFDKNGEKLSEISISTSDRVYLE